MELSKNEINRFSELNEKETDQKQNIALKIKSKPSNKYIFPFQENFAVLIIVEHH